MVGKELTRATLVKIDDEDGAIAAVNRGADRVLAWRRRCLTSSCRSCRRSHSVQLLQSQSASPDSTVHNPARGGDLQRLQNFLARPRSNTTELARRTGSALANPPHPMTAPSSSPRSAGPRRCLPESPHTGQRSRQQLRRRRPREVVDYRLSRSLNLSRSSFTTILLA